MVWSWWCHLELLPPGDLGVERCVLFDSIRGPLQSVHRSELWGVILALHCSSAVHLDVDNLNVVRHVSRFLEGRVSDEPLELTFDGDLLAVIERMVHQRGVQYVKISRVKGHADDDMVAWVGFELKIGLVMILLIGLLISVSAGSLIWSLMSVDFCLCLFHLVSCCFGVSSFLYCHRSCCC